MKDKLKEAYRTQRNRAKYRSIDWQFTYEEWIAWWGDDITKRGKGKGKLCMARFNDTGAYHPNNCRKATHEENAIEAKRGRTLSAEHIKNMSICRIGKPHPQKRTKYSQVTNIGVTL
jgi:hypothetical protein